VNKARACIGSTEVVMGEDRAIELLVELHRGLARLGPGGDEVTRHALALCSPRPQEPAILDIGAGTGAQSLCLAHACNGRVVAVDRFTDFVGELAGRAEDAGLAGRITPCVADMGQLPFGEAGFDIVWCEGAAYLLGFDTALDRWRPLLRPGGWLVVTELTWFGDARPPEAVAFWAENYPALRDEAANLAAARDRGWRVVGRFHLPASAWATYHAPLRERLPAFRARHAGDAVATAVADATEAEIDLMTRHATVVGYGCYVLQHG
jgi:SAM-dependent methyltransferase